MEAYGLLSYTVTGWLISGVYIPTVRHLVNKYHRRIYILPVFFFEFLMYSIAFSLLGLLVSYSLSLHSTSTDLDPLPRVKDGRYVICLEVI